MRLSTPVTVLLAWAASYALVCRGDAEHASPESGAVRRHRSAQSAASSGRESAASSHRYLDSWAVEIDGGEMRARSVAWDHGFDMVEKSDWLGNVYHFQLRDSSRRHRRNINARAIAQLRSMAPLHGHTHRLNSDSRVRWAEQQHVQSRTKRSVVELPSDPMFNKQWYLHNTGQTRSPAGFDHDVLPVWNQGFTGRGVTMTIVDDGVERTHPDLVDNYSKHLSHDFNNGDEDPSPRYDGAGTNKHGTRCAGVAAAARNNICGTGVAYGSKIGGVRLLDGRVTDLLDSNAISLRPQHIDIYSNSWGPTDNGMTVGGPGRVTRRTLSANILKGRDGLGSIFMWASGVGGFHGDSCAYDGFINSIYTIAISAGTDGAHAPWYAEPCAAVTATGLSSGNPLSKKVVSTDLHQSCTDQFSGTSAATPMMAGVVALILQARPHLTWRDVQHIIVLTSRPNILHGSSSNAHAEQEWVTNACGRRVNPWFGYGVINATAMLELAKRWLTVLPLHSCYTKAYNKHRPISMDGIKIQITTEGCRGKAGEVTVLEQVQLVLSMKSNYRGAIIGYLTSPQGTRVQIVFRRHVDHSSAGLHKWPFTSTFTWGEDPRGTWTLELRTTKQNARSVLERAQLVLHGTSGVHAHYAKLAKSDGGMTCSQASGKVGGSPVDSK
ncbi:furin-like [Sycon ciliatum]|uniref:furin-like n=1 Tax=Sycon ciliatum TaxID=27933 RepID=UPI0031F6AD27